MTTTHRRVAATVLALGIALTGASSADAAGANKNLRCFSDPGASCTLTKEGALLVAGVNLGAGVYVNGKRANGKPLSAVDFTFSWAGTPNGGAPRFSIPIDEDGDGTTEGYAFLDWASCSNAPTGGTVTTTSSTCAVDFGPTRYANWDAFAAAHPDYTISAAIPFIIADYTADVYVFNMTIG